MENATKALLIAGTVLVAIVMISIGVYLYSLYSNQSKEYSEIISTTELQKFNSKFSVYIGRDNIKAQEIVSIVNLAKEYNNEVQIYLETTKLQFTATSTQEDFIKANQNKLFSCLGNNTNPTYDGTGKIIKLIFKNV